MNIPFYYMYFIMLPYFLFYSYHSIVYRLLFHHKHMYRNI